MVKTISVRMRSDGTQVCNENFSIVSRSDCVNMWSRRNQVCAGGWVRFNFFQIGIIVVENRPTWTEVYLYPIGCQRGENNFWGAKNLSQRCRGQWRRFLPEVIACRSLAWKSTHFAGMHHLILGVPFCYRVRMAWSCDAIWRDLISLRHLAWPDQVTKPYLLLALHSAPHLLNSLWTGKTY